MKLFKVIVEVISLEKKDYVFYTENEEVDKLSQDELDVLIWEQDELDKSEVLYEIKRIKEKKQIFDLYNFFGKIKNDIKDYNRNLKNLIVKWFNIIDNINKKNDK